MFGQPAWHHRFGDANAHNGKLDKILRYYIKIWGHGAGKFGLIFVSTLILAGIIYVGILSILMYKAQENRPEKPTL